MSVTFYGPFSGALRKKKRHGYFKQDGATAHTAIYSINVLNEVFENRLIDKSRIVACRIPRLKSL
jgi:hypothetical protein